ncbi:MAG: hypothetical protein AB7G39_09035 [Alphaproteobacteria bacterium]
MSRSARLLLAAVLALGLAHLLLLPPFEGFDETGHYSSILQIAETGKVPRLGSAWMTREVEAYQARGPMPYGPASLASGTTYRAFFQGDPAPRGTAVSPPFEASGTANWQGQHPPLYYLLLAPVAKATAGLPLRERLYWLRGASLLFAFAALCIAAAANARWIDGGGHLTALWPLLMPSWFPEMARLGNDSLACLLLALAWGAFLALHRRLDDLCAWLLLGVSLGLGLLTKAYVWPIALACFAYLAVLAICRRGAGTGIAAMLGGSLALALAVGAPWYLWLAASGIAPTNDAATLAQHGGLIAGLARYWSLPDFLYSLASLVKSFIWAGSWSFARPPAFFYLPYLAFMALLLGAWFWGSRRKPAEILPPLVFLLPMLLGLIGQSLLWLALGARGVTGGWYLHALVGPLAFVAAAGLACLARSAGGRALRAAVLVYALGFGAAMAWLQAGLFGGCNGRAAMDPVYRLDWSCASDAALLWQRLGLLAEPGFAAAAGVLGTALLVAGLLSIRNTANQDAARPLRRATS